MTSVVVTDHVGRGDIPVGPTGLPDSAPQQVDTVAGDGHVQADQGEDHPFSVHHPGRAQKRKGAEKGSHDRQRGNNPTLAATGQVIVFFADLAAAISQPP